MSGVVGGATCWQVKFLDPKGIVDGFSEWIVIDAAFSLCSHFRPDRELFDLAQATLAHLPRLKAVTAAEHASDAAGRAQARRHGVARAGQRECHCHYRRPDAARHQQQLQEMFQSKQRKQQQQQAEAPAMADVVGRTTPAPSPLPSSVYRFLHPSRRISVDARIMRVYLRASASAIAATPPALADLPPAPSPPQRAAAWASATATASSCSPPTSASSPRPAPRSTPRRAVARSDALRRVSPVYVHRFHASCAELWLRVSATCPVCRDSPVPSPAATPLAEAGVPLAAHAHFVFDSKSPCPIGAHLCARLLFVYKSHLSSNDPILPFPRRRSVHMESPGPEVFSLGFRFDPKPIDVVSYYLPHLIAGAQLHVAMRPFVHDADVYAGEPGELARMFRPLPKTGQRFFFTSRKLQPQRAGKAIKATRAAGAGSWQSQGSKDVLNKVKEKVGEVTKLRYKKGGKYTDWLMDQYSCGLQDAIVGGDRQLVFCNIYTPWRTKNPLLSLLHLRLPMPPPTPPLVHMPVQAPACHGRPQASVQRKHKILDPFEAMAAEAEDEGGKSPAALQDDDDDLAKSLEDALAEAEAEDEAAANSEGSPMSFDDMVQLLEKEILLVSKEEILA
ncbi:hypothetical protein HU200_054347 [Digitaria exilis]|uniref:NAC domain-containing protein n=1 Tax=Digitaria exilis TaxID=1010633 RepID=A0A835AIH1_9POAL|nr:hypothetical protein HU200_054347 [Digitaria exilis]